MTTVTVQMRDMDELQVEARRLAEDLQARGAPWPGLETVVTRAANIVGRRRWRQRLHRR